MHFVLHLKINLFLVDCCVEEISAELPYCLGKLFCFVDNGSSKCCECLEKVCSSIGRRIL